MTHRACVLLAHFTGRKFEFRTGAFTTGAFSDIALRGNSGWTNCKHEHIGQPSLSHSFAAIHWGPRAWIDDSSRAKRLRELHSRPNRDSIDPVADLRARRDGWRSHSGRSELAAPAWSVRVVLP